MQKRVVAATTTVATLTAASENAKFLHRNTEPEHITMASTVTSNCIQINMLKGRHVKWNRLGQWLFQSLFKIVRNIKWCEPVGNWALSELETDVDKENLNSDFNRDFGTIWFTALDYLKCVGAGEGNSVELWYLSCSNSCVDHTGGHLMTFK